MILFFENGRLGNQIIQYLGLKNKFYNEKLYFIGCKSLFKTFNNLDAVYISQKKIKSFLNFGILMKIISFLVKIRILGKISENRYPGSYKIVLRRGLFWRIFVVDNFFYNFNEAEASKNIPDLKSELIFKAKEWLKTKKINIETDCLVFVHIRRGDYLYWPSKEFPAVLSLEWYKKAMSQIKKKIKNPIFILMSDDKYYLDDVFEESNSLYISKNNYEIDFSIMSMFSYGIMSASTFSWCGAFYSNHLRKNKTFYLAPDYWIYHRQKKEMKDYIGNFITYI